MPVNRYRDSTWDRHAIFPCATRFNPTCVRVGYFVDRVLEMGQSGCVYRYSSWKTSGYRGPLRSWVFSAGMAKAQDPVRNFGVLQNPVPETRFLPRLNRSWPSDWGSSS